MTCITAQNQKQSSRAMRIHPGIKAQERTESELLTLPMYVGHDQQEMDRNRNRAVVKIICQKTTQTQSCFRPLPPPLQPSSASLHIGLDDNLQNISFYFYFTDLVFHLLVLVCNTNRNLSPVISLHSAAHLFIRPTTKK